MVSTKLGCFSWIGKGLVSVALGFGLLHAGNVYAQKPVISVIIPSSKAAGSPAFTLTVTGTGFTASSIVQWNGSSRATTVVSLGTTLDAQILASDVAVAGEANVTVVNPGPVASDPVVFKITAFAPTITSISPSTVVSGGPAFTLTVTGTNFSATSVVYWNGTSRPTTFVNTTTLTAAIPGSDIYLPGSATITVVDPASGGVASNPVTLTITSNTLYFPQVVVGGGYSTVFTVFSTAGGTILCTLTLKDQAGNDFPANITTAAIGPPSAAPVDREELSIGPYPFYLYGAGMKVVTVTPANPTDPAKVGWANIVYQSGIVYAVATYKYRPSGALTTSVGILSSQLAGYATIPVDNDDSQGRYTGFAIANPSSGSINVRLITLDQNGLLVDNVAPAGLNPLGPNQQISAFLHQYVPRSTFKGTMILSVQGGQQAVMTALVLEQGIYSAIPVVPDKSTSVP